MECALAEVDKGKIHTVKTGITVVSSTSALAAEGTPLCPTCAPVKANGAARKARERDKRATETRLRGWACEIRTQKCRRKLSL
jgi:hypothetical protein